MTAYTRESPFDYGGIGYYLNRDREALVVNTFGAESITDMRASDARAIHALIEAERDTWAWTNADRSEARRGRWYTFRDGAEWAIRHDDFESSEITKNAVDRNGRFLRDALHELGSFLTWAATQTPPPPAEPSGFGAVVEDGSGDTWTRADRGTLPWFLARQDGNGGRCSWDNWATILTFGPVTVLSQGVTR